MEVHKTPLRPGTSYALKTSVLSAVVGQAGLKTPIVLHHRSESWWTEGVLFRADFYPPGGSREDRGEVLHVSCRSVPSSERRSAQAFLEGFVLPDFTSWLAELERLPDNATRRRERPSFAREWKPQTVAEVRSGSEADFSAP
jgi:hypothetical protein